MGAEFDTDAIKHYLAIHTKESLMKSLSLLLLFTAASAAASPPPTPPTPPSPGVPRDSAPASSQWLFKHGASEIEIRTTGNVTFDAASDALFDLHGDGTLRVNENEGKTVRTLITRGTTVTWKVNGTARPFNASGKSWLRKILKARPTTPTPPAPTPK
ncbi:MAG: hypothetical protein R3B48_27825 [Kofleriaceae bacterium]